MAGGRGLYSRAVAILKVGLPLVAVGLLAALFLIQTEDGLDGEIVFSQGDLAALGSGLRISNPTFTGTTRDDDQFRFTAELVEPDAAPPTRARITALDGWITFRDGAEVEVSAATGALDIPAQRLDLSGAVRIATSDGYLLETDAVTLDLRTGVIAAGGPVETQGALGRIVSGSLRIAPVIPGGATHLISFGDGVRVVYDPASKPD